jgi:hypothetical protein
MLVQSTGLGTFEYVTNIKKMLKQSRFSFAITSKRLVKKMSKKWTGCGEKL